MFDITPEQAKGYADVILTLGLGVASFIVLVYFVYKTLKTQDETRKIAAKVAENHLVHAQEALEKIVVNTSISNTKLEEQTRMLVSHGEKLDMIINKK
jgi:hypothetical protein